MYRIFYSIFITLLSLNIGLGQAVVWTEPSFPIQSDHVKVFFDAKEGNMGLQGYFGDVYAHTGVITSNSANDTDWQHVIGNWGTVDSRVLMTDEGNDVYSISYTIEEFYGIDPGEEVYKMAFVFRSSDGSVTGRDEDGSDIYTEVFSSGQNLLATIVTPGDGDNIIPVNDSIQVVLQVNQVSEINITDNGSLVFSESTQNVNFYIHPDGTGNHTLIFEINGETEQITLSAEYYVIDGFSPAAWPPTGVENGLNYYTDTSYIFALTAPGKSYGFLLCPYNNFRVNEDFLMNRSQDGNIFWIELPRSFFVDGQNSYQYLVDGASRIADPYSEIVLDPWNDGGVDPLVMEELPDYPEGLTSGIVTAFDLEEESFPWEIENFEKPKKTDLVIYEILMRDFLEDSRYTSLIDTLDYLEGLGINAIELMPVNEFEGNQSWGYNPSYHMALDKYYGSRDEFKLFIDEAHKRGIAVILDVVYNHAFSQSPLAQLYWDAANFRPAASNPWLNVEARHPFNVGYDFNHESNHTKKFVNQVLKYWITEFKVDGFRFDLSKGFTQTYSIGNPNLMAKYDPSRIAILKSYADKIWALDADSYVILEHFADNEEEKEFSDYGMMLWTNSTFQYAEAAMGYSSDLDWTLYTDRGWDNPHLISYMESHDEERMGYKLKQYGNSNGNHNAKELPTALKRTAATSVLYFSLPGPKMLWQFGELGYDYSINRCVNGTISDNCRLDPKPIRWDYNDSADRKRVYNVISALADLKINYPTFETTEFTFDDSDSYTKRVHLNHSEMNAVTLANFNVEPENIIPDFQSAGTWYEYFSGDSLIVSNTTEAIEFKPGEYRIYTSERITPPNGYFPSSVQNLELDPLSIYPNPVYRGGQISLNLPPNIIPKSIKLVTINGSAAFVPFDNYTIQLSKELNPGVYILRIETKNSIYNGKLIIK